MADFTIKRGDTLPVIAATLADENGPIDLTGATVRFHLRTALTGEIAVDGAATVTDADAGTVEYEWEAGDTAVDGDYRAEWEITFSGGATLTCPNDTDTTLTIYRDLA